MNEKTLELIALANKACHCQTLLNIIANKPSIDPSYLPIVDLIKSAYKFDKVDHRIEIRGVISAQFYELANTDFAAANELVNSLGDGNDLKLQLDAVLLVVMNWRSRKQA